MADFIPEIWLEKQHLYVTMAYGDNFERARQFAQTNEHHAPVFSAEESLQEDSRGVLFLPDGTYEHMTYQQALVYAVGTGGSH